MIYNIKRDIDDDSVDEGDDVDNDENDEDEVFQKFRLCFKVSSGFRKIWGLERGFDIGLFFCCCRVGINFLRELCVFYGGFFFDYV